MIPRGLALVVAVVLFCPSLLRAQEQTKTFDPFAAVQINAFEPSGSKASNSGTMYEDIEIFRRILDRKLQPLYPRSHHVQNFGSMMGMGGEMMGMMGMGGGMMNMQPQPMYLTFSNPILHQEITPTLEGVYLKGQGIVYTVTLSSLQAAAKAEAPKPVSEWESVRRQLRKEKEEPKKPEAAKPPTMADALLKVLAENGHNFSQLGANESLTIVLTVHDANPSSPPRRSAGGGSGGSPKKASPAPKPAGSADVQGKVSDLELLGDLHQKQGHFVEAVDAYKKAVAVEPRPKNAPTLYCKMAQCYLALGWDENARKTLDEISALLKESADAKEKPAPTAKPAVTLPVKLIISTPKKLLDQMKEGKITFEEFRSKAHVETLRFDNRR